MGSEDPNTGIRKVSPEERARPTTPWKVVFSALFITFAAMAAAIYWVIRTGKL
jgi:hypothetical protein